MVDCFSWASIKHICYNWRIYNSFIIIIVYQEVKKDEVSAHATIGTDYSSEIWGISFAQGDWAISYVEQTETKEAVSDTAAVEAEMTAINASYTMGAMSIKGGFFETSNPEWTTGSYEETEIALSFAF